MTVLSARRHLTARGPIEAAVTGGGPAVILVHGIPGSWRQGVPLALDLAAAHTVVLPSRPGYGTTPLSTGHSPVEQAGAYAALLDALDLPDAAVVGISGGGPSALAFAKLHPARTRALVLCCALADCPIRTPAGLRVLAVPGLGEVVSTLGRWWNRHTLGDPVAVGRALARGLTADEQARAATDPSVRDDLVAFARSHLDAPPGLAGLRNDLAQLARNRDSTAAPSDPVTVATLVLHGDADTVVPVQHARHHAGAIAGAVTEIYAGAGHVFLLTRRREVSARIAGFLSSVASPEGRP